MMDKVRPRAFFELPEEQADKVKYNSHIIYNGYELSAVGIYEDDQGTFLMEALNPSDDTKDVVEIVYAVYGMRADDGLAEHIADYEDYDHAKKVYNHLCVTLQGAVACTDRG